MQLVLDRWTIVANGDWNKRLFTPEWVGTHLFPDQQHQMGVILSPGETAYRHETDSLIVVPSNDKLVIGIKHFTEDILRQACVTMKTALTLLSHTPIRGMGINICYDENNVEEPLCSLLNSSDDSSFYDRDHPIIKRELVRGIKLDDCMLNYGLSYSNLKMTFFFNYHFDVHSPNTAAELLDAEIFNTRRLDTLEHLKSAYGINIDTQSEHINNEESSDEE